MPAHNAVTKSLEFHPHKMRPRDSIAHVGHGSYTVSSSNAVHYTPTSGSPKKLGKFGSREEAISHAQEHHASIGKSARFRLVTLDECYDALIKDQAGQAAYHADAARRKAPDPSRTAHVDRPPPTTSDVGSRPQSERRKFPRKLKPTVQMRPIDDAEAMAHLRSGTYNPNTQKALRWLRALKAFATGYGKTSGDGALKAANRGRSMPLLGPSGRVAGKSGGSYRKRGLSGKRYFGPDGRPGPRDEAAKFGGRFKRAMEAMSAPVGSVKPPKVYLPGVHNPKSPVRHGSKRPAGVPRAPAAVGKSTPLVVQSRPVTASKRSPKTLDAGGAAAELSNSLDNVVIKGAEMPTVDFNDLFKSELAADHLVDCPHCDHAITKSDLEKAHRGKGKTTQVSGTKQGKSSAHVRDHNPEGGAMRGGDGRGVHTPSRGVPGAQKTDPAVGIQNNKGSHARKGGNADSSIEEGEDDVDKSEATPQVTGVASSPPKPTEVKKSITVRGTEWVRYVDDGSDAALAKSIAEGTLGGTSPTRPLDLNNDLTRLLI